MTPEEKQKLYELADAIPTVEEIGNDLVTSKRARAALRQLEALRHAVLDLCKPPEPEKFEIWLVSGPRAGLVPCVSEDAAKAVITTHTFTHGTRAEGYTITYLSGIKGQGKPEEGA